MTALNKQALREELEICSKDRMRRIALALLDELEAAENRIAEHNFENRLLANADRDIKALRQRIAELESRTITVKFEPIPMEELGNRRDGKKHPYMFGAGYNSAVVHCESVLHQACAAAGIGVKGE